MTDDSKPTESGSEDRRVSGRRMSGVEVRTIQANHHVFREGEIGDLAFIVQTGTVEIYKHVEGNKVILGTLGVGGMFGEMALIDDKPRMASACAVGGDATVMVISRKIFAKKMTRMDPFARGLIKILSNYIRSKNYQPEDQREQE